MPSSKKTDIFNKEFLDKMNVKTDLDPDNIKSASAAVKKALSNLPPNQGIHNTATPEPTLNFIQARNAKSIHSRNKRCGIVFGADRPHVLQSGQGGKGANRANTIDIVAGRMACKDGDIAKGKIKAINPHFACDAARVYVSQRTEIDLHMGLADGIIGSMTNIGMKRPPASAVAIKADDARIIGRNGVKIVSGRSFAFKGAGLRGETNSRGGPIQQPSPPIELIAGNITDTATVFGGLRNPLETVNDLQGVSRGEFTRDAIKELGEMIEQILSAVERNTQLSEMIAAITGISVWEPYRPAGIPVILGTEIVTVNSSLWVLRLTKILWDINYLHDFGYKYVVSQNVFST
jgi:hypothetical protein